MQGASRAGSRPMIGGRVTGPKIVRHMAFGGGVRNASCPHFLDPPLVAVARSVAKFPNLTVRTRGIITSNVILHFGKCEKRENVLLNWNPF